MQCKTPIYNLYRSTKYHNLFTTTSCSAGCLMIAMMIINSLSIVCLNAEVTQNNKINPNSIGTVSLSRTLLLIYLDPELYVNKSAFSYLHKMTTWHCPHSPTTRHCCSNWSISPACCRFAAVGPCWDRQTNRWKPYHFIDTAMHTMLINQMTLQINSRIHKTSLRLYNVTQILISIKNLSV